MAVYKSRSFKTKDNAIFEIRSATPEDAEQMLEMVKPVFAEEIYQLTSSEEFKMTIEDQKKWVSSVHQKPFSVILLAILNGKVVGILDFSNGHRKRIEHTGEFGMSVAKDLREMKIGSALVDSLIDWAKQTQKIEKINLCVHKNNLRAQALYKKFGFKEEGIRTNDLKYGPNEYVDTVLMGLCVCNRKC